MPSTSIDTFFACTIIVAVALIATAFLTSTMQTSINSTQDINKESYLQSIADHIITSPGAPVNWGSSSIVPADFGLAAGSSKTPYQLDIDKITRLNNLNTYSLSYADMENAAKLNNIALGITVSQVMSISLEQTGNSTIDNGNKVSFSFAILTSINSEPTRTSLNCYVVANNYLSNLTGSTSTIGVGAVTFQIPSSETGNAMLIVFARASFDDRITSYAIYNFLNSTQESAPSNTILTLTPLNYILSFSTNFTDIIIQRVYIFTYMHQQNLTPVQSATQYSIPTLIDKSPFVIVTCGFDNATYFQEWTSYPQVPFKAGSSFEDSEQNIFTYIVTINGVLYNVYVSFGDVVP
ncbi:MAG: hypothetical protein ABSF44_12135 [Candidatus Bathyarchaeia archaeon]